MRASDHNGDRLSRRGFLLTAVTTSGLVGTWGPMAGMAWDQYDELTSADYLGQVRVEARSEDKRDEEIGEEGGEGMELIREGEDWIIEDSER